MSQMPSSAGLGQYEVRGDMVLRSERRRVTLRTADGLDLVGELALPLGRAPRGTIITLHPLPLQGGCMSSHVLRKAAQRLPELADIAVLRFNTRGTFSPHGASEGHFDYAQGERYDVLAALEAAEFAEDPELPNRWLVGWSFGTDLTLMYGADPSISGAVLLSPPLRWSQPEHLAAWAEFGRPLVALVPEHDDFLRPPEAQARFSVIPQAEVVPVAGAKHLWVGEQYVRRVLDEIVARVTPGAAPLPTSVTDAQRMHLEDHPDETALPPVASVGPRQS